jgi:phosphoglycerate dehydrogenase-like enzyme
VLRASDVVVLCFGGSGGEQINATTLALMKPSAYLVVMAHGPGVDEGALYTALHSQAIAGAAINEWWEGWGWRPPHGFGGFAPPAAPVHPFESLANVLMAPNDCEKSDVYWQESARGLAANLDQLAAGETITRCSGSQ